MDLSSYMFIQNPYDTYEHLHREYPVYHCPEKDYYYVASYELVKAVFCHPNASSNRVKTMTDGLPEPVLTAIKPLTDSLSKWLLFLDPPFHGAIRKVINASLSKKVVDSLKPEIEQIASELLSFQRDSFDLMSGFAYPLPVLVISQMLGIPSEDRSKIKSWSESLAVFLGDRTSPEQIFAVQQSIAEATDYFTAHVISQRENPSSDIIVNMLKFQTDNPAFTDEYLIANLIALLFAGHETTSNAIGNGYLNLLRNSNTLPSQTALLQNIEGLVNESLRYESPVQRMGRFTIGEIDLGTCIIPEGKRVLLLIGAANRDPLQFEEPNTFTFNRQRNNHIAFGYGHHLCSGTYLAKVEMAVALSHLLHKFRLNQIDVSSYKWRKNLGLRGLALFKITSLSVSDCLQSPQVENSPLAGS